MRLRTFLPLIFLLLIGSTVFAQEPQPAPEKPAPSSAQTMSTEPQPLSVAPAVTDAPDILNPPANFVSPPVKKSDGDPGDAPLLMPIPPAENAPFNTAEYRSNKIPWEPFPTAISPAQ